MELNWDFFLNFSEDAIFPENFFKENNENTVLEDIITPPESPENFYIEINENTVLEDIITPPKSPNNFFVETNENTVLEDIITPPEFSDNFFNEPPIELFFQSSVDNFNTYQYNLRKEDSFDDWMSVDTFMYNYCLERGFGYQICRNDKNPNNPSITIRKSYRCSFGGTYKPRKNINQELQRERGSNKFNCQWHCNFTLQKLENRVKCTTLEDIHNHELIPTDIPHLNARYRQFNNEMMQDLKFFTECKVAPVVQLEILKKKYPQHVFHKQDVYNSIYRLRKNNEEENSDTTSFLNIFLEKIIEDPHWKIFVRHSGNERRLSGIFWMSPSQHELYQQFHDVVLNDNTCKTNKYNMYLSVFMIKDNYGKFRNVANALVEDEMASTYIWILQCLMKATNNITPKAFWTDSEPGLINAAAHVFPTTPHFYCLFHIWQNITKHLKTKLGTKFHSFSKAFYLCRNTLSIELFEQRWGSMMNEFPESQPYMTRVLYPNRNSWAKAYTPFQFNAGIQSTQSVESFNAIIKKALNSASSLCDIEKVIDKRHEAEFQYCKLANLKAYQTTVGLPHLSSQFFSNIDAVLNQFLTPLVLSWQKFQISQSFTYEGHLVSSLNEVSNVLLRLSNIY
jgi:hypothetical protein